MNNNTLRQYNTTSLAFMGDAVFEVYIRKHVMDEGEAHADVMHKRAVEYVRAEAQAIAIKQMIKDLDPHLQALVKRARNHKITSKPKHADPMTYKWATAFEALIGYLYLDGQLAEMKGVIERAITIIEGSSKQKLKNNSG